MSTELKTMVNTWVAIISVGVALAGLIFTTQGSLREEMRDEFKVQRAETQAEFRAVRAEIQTLRSETQAEFKSVRAEMQAQRAETQAEFKAQREIITNLLGRMAHVEGLLEGLREAFTGWRADAVAKAPERYDPH